MAEGIQSFETRVLKLLNDIQKTLLDQGAATMAGIADINDAVSALQIDLNSAITTATAKITTALKNAGIPQSEIDATVANIKAVQTTLDQGMAQIGNLVNPPPPPLTNP